MYIPKVMRIKDKIEVEQFIEEFGFGVLISSDLNVTHIPMIYEPEAGDLGRIVGHMAKANQHWLDKEGQRVSALFNGPHAYISPTFYATKPAVPTWNYAAVQCFGTFKTLTNEQTKKVIDKLIDKYESNILNNDILLPDDYYQRLLHAVVGFSIEIDDMQGKEKLGQHKSSADQQGVFEGLLASQRNDAQQLVHYMRKRGLVDISYKKKST